MANPTVAEIEDVVYGKYLAESRSEFAESIKCTATVIAGDRYKITFSDESSNGEGW